MEEGIITKLENRGFKRWIRGNMDRLYINAKELGLVCTYYKTGNIHSAEFDGNDISNSEGYRMKAAKTFVDVKTGKVYGDNERLKKKAEEIVKEVMA